MVRLSTCQRHGFSARCWQGAGKTLQAKQAIFCLLWSTSKSPLNSYRIEATLISSSYSRYRPYRVSAGYFTKLSTWRSCGQWGRNTSDIRGKSANAQFGKTQFLQTRCRYAFIFAAWLHQDKGVSTKDKYWQNTWMNIVQTLIASLRHFTQSIVI